MKNHQNESKLFRDSLEEKRHYKLYKKGKLWLIAGISLFSSSLVVFPDNSSVTAHAATDAAVSTSAVTSATTNQQQVTLKTSQVTDPATSVQADGSLSSADDASTSQSETASSVNDASTSQSETTSGTGEVATNQPETATTAAESTVTQSETSTADQTKAKTVINGTDTTTPTSSTQSTTANDGQSVTTPAVSKGSPTTATKVTTYSAETGQKLVKQATDISSQIATTVTQGATVANQSETDNIPTDKALTALATHATNEVQSVTDAVAQADSQSVTNLDSAVSSLNLAATIVNNMSQELVQAGVLLESDKKGVSASVLVNAQAAQERASLPDGVTTELDAYGDLIVNAPSSAVYQAVVTALTQQGLTASFREIVDPNDYTGTDTVAFTWGTDISGSKDTTATTPGDSYKFTSGQQIPLKITMTGTAGDTFSFTTSKGAYFEAYNGTPTVVSNTDGSLTYTWTLPGTGNQIYAVNVGKANLLRDVASGAQQTITLAINNEAVPTATQTFTLDPNIKITSGTIFAVNQSEKTTDEPYIYGARFNISGSDYTDKFYASIPVPSNFKLDEEMTTALNKTPEAKGVLLQWLTIPSIGSTLQPLTISQPGGVGTPIIAEQDQANTYLGNFNNATGFYFIGEYTSLEATPTDGSVGASGYVTYANGSTQYFGETNVDNGDELDIANAFTGLTTPTFTDTTGTTAVTGYTGTIKRGIGSNASSDIIGILGMSNGSTTEKTPSITMTIPDELTSTGIVMPIANIGTYYDKTPTSYEVVATDTTGKSVTQTLAAGQSWNPLTGQIDTAGKLSTGEALATDSKIEQYTINYQNAMYPDAFDRIVPEFPASDVNAYHFTVLGYANDHAVTGTTYQMPVTITADGDDSNVSMKVAIQTVNPNFINQDGNATGSSLGDDNKIVVPGGTTTLSYNTNGYGDGTTGSNLDAYDGSPYNLSGNNGLVAAGIFEPIVYVTVPEQMTLQLTNGLPYSSKNTIAPTLTSLKNQNGQTVLKMDWTGTGYTTNSNDGYVFTFNVDSTATSTIVANFGQSPSPEYVYSADGGTTYDKKTAAQLAALGVSSTAGLQEIKSPLPTGTSAIQFDTASLKGATLNNGVASTLTLSDGTVIQTTTLKNNGDVYDRYTIIAPQSLLNTPTIQGTADGMTGYSVAAHNYPVVDYTGTGDTIQGLQHLQITIVNNFTTDLTSAWNVTNLPQTGQTDPNAAGGQTADFTLKLSGALQQSSEATNNVKGDPSAVYYATDAVSYSTDSTALNFADGTSWTIDSSATLPSELLTLIK